MPASVVQPPKDDTVSPAEAQAALDAYNRAVEQRLLPSLEAACEQRDKAFAHVAEAEQMGAALDVLDLATSTQSKAGARSVDESGRVPPALETRVNIGEEFYMAAEVRVLEPIVVDVGLGVLVEMNREEARAVVRERRKVWGKVAEREESRIAEIRAHLKGVMKCLGELEAAEGEGNLLGGREYILGNE